MGTLEALVEADKVPHPDPEQFDPERIHPIPCVLFTTVAVNVWVAPPEATVAVVGATDTVMTGAVMVNVALALTLVFEIDVAFKVTVAGLGTVPGAV
jgi:hypothetical protein